jgi:kynurenine formamidase/GNAT superfamily N-acetyltransferase
LFSQEIGRIMQDITISIIQPQLAKDACLAITTTLPEWFGIPEANTRYQQGMLSRISFAAVLNDEVIGMLTLEFPYSNNANIYWMAVKKNYHGKKIGKKLLQAAENYCLEHAIPSLTVETLSPQQRDENYQKTYQFYVMNGFRPLFEMSTYDPDNLMVYLQKPLSFGNFKIIDLTHSLTPEIPQWGIECGFRHHIVTDYSDCASPVKFRVQRLEMVGGIGTHMDAPAHCIPGSATIDELPLTSLITPCRVIDVSQKAHERYLIPIEDIQSFEKEHGSIPKNSFVILHTGWGEYWDNPLKYRNNLIFPSLSLEAAKLLLTRDIIGLGIDTLSPDRGGSRFPIHQLLLTAGKYIVENVANAKKLGPIGFAIALPIKIQNGTEAPIRLVGLKQHTSF